jgi:putative membrane protein
LGANVPVVGLVFAVLAALIHVYIFVLESLRWTAPKTRAIFGTSEDGALATRQLAFNQGFYNLFLAIITIVGVALLGEQEDVGRALALAGTGSMLGAALVLVTHDGSMARAAITQGTLPALAVLFLLLSM